MCVFCAGGTLLVILQSQSDNSSYLRHVIAVKQDFRRILESFSLCLHLGYKSVVFVLTRISSKSLKPWTGLGAQMSVEFLDLLRFWKISISNKIISSYKFDSGKNYATRKGILQPSKVSNIRRGVCLGEGGGGLNNKIELNS